MICEICGQKITPPNYIVNRSGSPEWEEYLECASCNLDRLREQLKEYLLNVLEKGTLKYINNQLDVIRTLEANLNNPITTLYDIFDCRSPKRRKIDKGIAQMIDYFNLEEDYIKKEIKEILEIITEKDLANGRTIEYFLYSAFIYIIRKHKIPIFTYEILNYIFSIKKDIPYNLANREIKRKLRNHYNVMMKELNLKHNHTLEIVNCFISRSLAHFNMDLNLENYIKNFMILFHKECNMDNKNPIGYLAGILYLIGQIYEKKITPYKIAEFIGITEVTLSKRIREIYNYDKYDEKIKEIKFFIFLFDKK